MDLALAVLDFLLLVDHRGVVIMDLPEGPPENSSSSSSSWLLLPPPMMIDRPEAFVLDPTCHGILGSTLRQALDQLLLEEEREHVAAAAGASPRQTTNDPPATPTPPVPRDKESRRRRRSSSSDDDNNDDESMDGASGSEESAASRPPPAPQQQPFTSDMVAPILNSLGHAMVTTSERRRRNVPVRDWVAGLVQGRVQHYQRRGTKWRIVADSDAQLQVIRPHQRRILYQKRSSTSTTTPLSGTGDGLRQSRRRNERTSLWEAALASTTTTAAGKSTGGGTAAPVTLAHPLEILAYNDNE